MWETFIVDPLTNVLLFIYMTVGQNFGVAIILFTILIRAVTHPLTVQQLKGTQAMQDMQKDKDWLAAQEKFKGDKEKLSQEQMRLYKEKGINPLASCLPTVIQFPIIIGLYQGLTRALTTTPLELLSMVRIVYPQFIDVSALVPLQSQFLWMDLGQPERVNIPGLPFGIPVLALIVMVTTFLQSKMMAPAAGAGGGNDQTAQMTGMMNIYMPLLMGYISLTLASGLAIYFVTSNVVGIIQYAMLGKLNWKALLPAPRKDQPKDQPKAAEINRGKNDTRKNNVRSNRSNRK